MMQHWWLSFKIIQNYNFDVYNTTIEALQVEGIIFFICILHMSLVP
jgi:hypothetical protein